MGEEQPSKQQYSKLWIIYAFSTSLCFCMCNFTKSKMAIEVGYYSLAYQSFGQVIASIVYDLFQCVQTARKDGRFWSD